MTADSTSQGPSAADDGYARTSGRGPSWRGLLAVVAVAFALRLAWILVATRVHLGLHDPVMYRLLATTVADGQGYVGFFGTPTAYFPPGYPLVLAAAIALTRTLGIAGDVAMTGAVLNLLLGTATVAMVGLLGWRLAGPGVGALAALLCALFPSLILYTSVLLTETLFNALFVAALLVLWWRPWRDDAGAAGFPAPWRLVVAGLLFGAAILVRPTIAPALALLTLAFLLARASIAQWLRGSAALVGAAVLVVAPWTVRNYLQMDAFLPISTNTGDNLCMGNNPQATGEFGLFAFCMADLPSGDPVHAEVARNALLTERALSWIRANPSAQPALLARRLYFTLRNDQEALRATVSYGKDPWLSTRQFAALRVLSDSFYYAVLAMAVLGLGRFLTRSDPRSVAMALVVIGILLAPAAFFGEARFHVPLLPMACILAAMAVSGVRGSARNVERPAFAPTARQNDG